MNIPGCLSCDILAGRREVPGDTLYQTVLWTVEHCVGPLPLGTLILKPNRHVLSVADLTEAEISEFGPLLLKLNKVVKEVCQADQVYNCQWSHEHFQPGTFIL